MLDELQDLGEVLHPHPVPRRLHELQIRMPHELQHPDGRGPSNLVLELVQRLPERLQPLSSEGPMHAPQIAMPWSMQLLCAIDRHVGMLDFLRDHPQRMCVGY